MTQWTADHVRALLPAVDASPWGPFEGPGDVLPGAFLFEYADGGAHALLAVRPVALQMGNRLDVVAMVSTGDRIPGKSLDAALVAIAETLNTQQIAMCTGRDHVARQCARHGWTQTGVIMTKGLYGRTQ